MNKGEAVNMAKAISFIINQRASEACDFTIRLRYTVRVKWL